jgi:hypothetical protein
VSDPTYRIDVEHRPGEGYWCATTVRLSDDFPVDVKHRTTPEAAVEAAREWIAATNGTQPSFSVLVDDDGRPVGHSVKA